MVPLTGGASELVLSGPLLVALLIAAAAGAVSFFSPCCLPQCRDISPTWLGCRVARISR
jgi:hypothetical protein